MDPFADFEELRSARELWSRGAMGQGVQAFRAALSANPSNIRARVEAARAFAQVFEVDAAEQLLDEACGLARGARETLAAIVPAYAQVYRPAKALEGLETLWRSGPLPAPTLGELAKLYERAGHYDAAREAIEDVRRSAPADPAAALIAGRLLRREQPSSEAITALESVATAPDTDLAVVANAWGELCHAHDAGGDADRAIEAIERAKSLLREHPRAAPLADHSRRLHAVLAALARGVSESDVSDWEEAAPPLTRGVLGFAHLIGFPRSGTTLVEQMLASHPDVFLSSERTVLSAFILPNASSTTGRPHLSVESLHSLSNEQLAQSRDRYVACCEAVEGRPAAGRVLLDKNPNHTSLAPAITRLLPESRYVFAVRDPRDVLVSAYLRVFPLSEYSVNFLDLQTAAAMYATEMQNWWAFREAIPGRWAEVRYEEVLAQPRTALRSAVDLLGLDWRDDLVDYRDRIAGRDVNSPSHDAVRLPRYDSSRGRWRLYERLLDPVMPILRPWVERLGYDS